MQDHQKMVKKLIFSAKYVLKTLKFGSFWWFLGHFGHLEIPQNDTEKPWFFEKLVQTCFFEVVMNVVHHFEHE